MHERICRWLGWALAVIAACGMSVAARGQEGWTQPAPTGQYAAPMQTQQGGDPPAFDDIRARLEQQQQQIANLQDQLRSVQQAPQITPAADYPAQGNAAAKPARTEKAARRLPGRQRPECQGQLQGWFVPMA